MTAKHTPGPWTAQHCGGRTWDVFSADGKRRVAFTMLADGRDDLPTEANARLAAAAPTMLDALERVEWWLSTVPQGSAMRDVCRAAIKEARGE